MAQLETMLREKILEKCGSARDVARAFKYFDRDGSGILEREEFLEQLLTEGVGPLRDVVEQGPPLQLSAGSG